MTAAEFHHYQQAKRPEHIRAIVQAAEQTPGHKTLLAEVQRLLRERDK